LVDQTIALMNSGARLDEVLHSVKCPDHLTQQPYLQPVYDEPEFVVRNVWRQYGGWWDGNPATLKPAPESALAAELAELCGGAAGMADRALALVGQSGDGALRLAGHLAELASLAAPTDAAVQRARAEVFKARSEHATSTMAKGVFNWAARESSHKAKGT
jgi:alkyl sulfatase BDS1-like metallo-beta-lactamase superfamily hydrolase